MGIKIIFSCKYGLGCVGPVYILYLYVSDEWYTQLNWRNELMQGRERLKGKPLYILVEAH